MTNLHSVEKAYSGPNYPLTGELKIVDADRLGWCSKSTLSELCRIGELPCRRASHNSTFIKIVDLQRKFGEKPPGVNRRKSKKSKNLFDAIAADNATAIVKMADAVMAYKAPGDDVPQMTKEDRRIIFSEIDSRYYDETRGYQKGWNDEAVSKSLNVPRAWVRSIREDNFGPEHGDVIDVETINVRNAIDEAEKLLTNSTQLLKLIEERLDFFVKHRANLELTAKNLSETIEKAQNNIKSFIDMRNS